MFENIVEKTSLITTPSEITSLKNTIQKVKKAVVKSVRDEVLDIWNNKVKELVMQGEFTKLLISRAANSIFDPKHLFLP